MRLAFPAGPGAPEGAIKTSAAWLIEHAGFGKGFAVTPDARASLSTKHTLALTNRGGASAADVLALARAVRDGVQGRVRGRAGARARHDGRRI